MKTRPQAPDADATSLFDGLRDALGAHETVGERVLPLCRSGSVLRALLLVHAVLGVGLLFTARSAASWLESLAAAAMVALPATLAWLLAACAGRHWLARQPAALQLLGVSAAGALAAWGLWWPLRALDLSGSGMPSPAFPALAAALAGALLAALLFQSERWRERARLPAAAAASLADLQTRIRPHFLFNTLNTAIALVRHDPRRAEEVLEDLADLFRAALGALDQATTLDAEVALSRRYLAIEQLRFGRRLEVSWDLDAGAQARLPPLALQPLIENAVRHGIEPSGRGGSIEIRTRRRRDRVLISVTNTLADAPSRPGHGIGLASVRERLRLMHDLEADFRVGVIEDGRYRVSLSVPAESG